jgi:cbb3-type cytochrome oxidase cytochrome c subunit
MKSLFLGLLMVLFVFVRFAGAAEEAKEPAGKTIFLANKCNTCHSIASDKIEKTAKTTPKKAPPDLSTLGDKRTADWIVKYLKKTETIDKVKHVKTWTGKEEDLTVLAKWLESHKKPAS